MGWLLCRGLVFMSYVLIDHQVINLIAEHQEVSLEGSLNGDQPEEFSKPNNTSQNSCARAHDDRNSFLEKPEIFSKDSVTKECDTFQMDAMSTDTLWTISFLVCNGLAIVDLLLSRRSKLSTYRIRLAHRVAECNFKWCAFWFTWMLLSLLGPVLPDEHSKTTLALIGNRLKLSPIGFLSGFLAYALIVDRTWKWSQRLLYSRSAWWILVIKCISPDGQGTDTDINLLDADLDRIELVTSRVALPNVWLTPAVPMDYVKYLPTWRQLTNDCDTCDAECAICLEMCKLGSIVCQLPCQHRFHRRCIMSWLRTNNHHCPVCRRPTFQSKFCL